MEVVKVPEDCLEFKFDLQYNQISLKNWSWLKIFIPFWELFEWSYELKGYNIRFWPNVPPFLCFVTFILFFELKEKKAEWHLHRRSLKFHYIVETRGIIISVCLISCLILDSCPFKTKVSTSHHGTFIIFFCQLNRWHRDNEQGDDTENVCKWVK